MSKTARAWVNDELGIPGISAAPADAALPPTWTHRARQNNHQQPDRVLDRETLPRADRGRRFPLRQGRRPQRSRRHPQGSGRDPERLPQAHPRTTHPVRPLARGARRHRGRAVGEPATHARPVVRAQGRPAARSDELAGRAIARGTMIVISPYVLHRHRILWDDPDRFDPGRFLDGAAQTVDRYAYLPFGVGPRMCNGAGFALQEATTVLATIMRHFTPALAPGQTVWPLQ